MIDIDFFKKINDTYGHDVGDKVICSVAEAIKKTAREADVLARFGGEEFVVALPMTVIDAASLAGERIREAVEKLTIPSSAGDISVTVSVGVASFAATDDNIDMAIKRSDLALYDAKHGGRNQVRCFNPDALQTLAGATSLRDWMQNARENICRHGSHLPDSLDTYSSKRCWGHIPTMV